MAATTWERGQDTVLIGTIFVSVSIKVADITVGIATIKSIGSKSTSKAISAAKMPAMETTVELMESSAAEAAAPKSTAEGACMETPTEAAAMESSTAMAAAPPSQRFVIGEHQDCGEQRSDGNRQLVPHRIFSCCIDERMTLRRPKSTYRYSGLHTEL
ncbi:MAG TPA: hypothetical protein VNZ53_53620 [Steroidobacteraceae bacterium]|jgi:hypothetical protein|nr:hypothetical protein [Steroidobacteraceae bacterium]